MISNYKLDKSFGAVGTSAGLFLFIAGVILSFFYFSGWILILIGAFVGFTSTSTLIDDEKKRIRFSNNIFGIIKTGKWINIESDMKLGVRKSEVTWRAYGTSNQAIDDVKKDFRLILFDGDHKEIMQIMKLKTLDEANLEVWKQSERLGLSIFGL
ncbi:MAG: hypothetical protein WCL00_14540 [Bacteroidota bacterium]